MLAAFYVTILPEQSRGVGRSENLGGTVFWNGFYVDISRETELNLVSMSLCIIFWRLLNTISSKTLKQKLILKSILSIIVIFSYSLDMGFVKSMYQNLSKMYSNFTFWFLGNFLNQNTFHHKILIKCLLMEKFLLLFLPKRFLGRDPMALRIRRPWSRAEKRWWIVCPISAYF